MECDILYIPYLSWRSVLRSGSCCMFALRPWRVECTFLHTANRWCHSWCLMCCSRKFLRLRAPVSQCRLLRQERVTRRHWLCYCRRSLHSVRPQDDKELQKEKKCEWTLWLSPLYGTSLWSVLYYKNAFRSNQKAIIMFKIQVTLNQQCSLAW